MHTRRSGCVVFCFAEHLYCKLELDYTQRNLAVKRAAPPRQPMPPQAVRFRRERSGLFVWRIYNFALFIKTPDSIPTMPPDEPRAPVLPITLPKPAWLPGTLTAITIALAASYLAERHNGPQLLFALLLGMAFNFAADGPRVKAGIDFASKKILRFGVALLGARIGLDQVAALGAWPVAIIVLAVSGTIACGWLLSRLLRRPAAQGLLTGGAVAICGASAALALSAVIPRSQDQQRFTLLTVVGVTTLSTVAMVVYPLLADWIGLDARSASIFLGGTIHDVAQVAGAGFTMSPEIGEGAILVKLMRVALLVPAVLLYAQIFRSEHSAAADETGRAGRPPLLPGFLVGFMALVAANSFGIVPPGLAEALSDASRWCLVVAIAALGVKTSLGQLLTLGWAPITMMVAETVFIALVVLGGVMLLG